MVNHIATNNNKYDDINCVVCCNRGDNCSCAIADSTLRVSTFPLYLLVIGSVLAAF